MAAVSPAFTMGEVEHESIDGGLFGGAITVIVPQLFVVEAPLESVAVIAIWNAPAFL